VQEIADTLPISRPAVSRHLRLLSNAGLVAEEQVGARRLYHLQQVGVEAVAEYLQRVWGQAAARFQLFAENVMPTRKDT
jgi:DNA-binding transcriptional ArsR family regulator